MSSRELSRLITEFTKATRTLENSTNDIKNIIADLPLTKENILEKDLEKEIFEKKLKEMNMSQLEAQVTKMGNVMLSKSYYENLTDEIKEYQTNFDTKLQKEIGIVKERLNNQLQLEISKLTLTADKQIAIISQQLELSNQKLDYVCRLNNLESFIKVVAEPVVAEPVVAEPVVAEPVVTEPVVTEPIVTEPIVTEPIVTEPIVVPVV